MTKRGQQSLVFGWVDVGNKYLFCPPVIVIFPVVCQPLDYLNLGALIPVIVSNICLLFRVARKLQLLLRVGEKLFVYMELVGDWRVEVGTVGVLRHDVGGLCA